VSDLNRFEELLWEEMLGVDTEMVADLGSFWGQSTIEVENQGELL